MALRTAPILTTAVLVFLLGAVNARAQVQPPRDIPPTASTAASTGPAPPARAASGVRSKIKPEPDAVYHRCGPQGQDLRDTPCPDSLGGHAAPLPKDRVDPKDAAAARQRIAAESRDTAAKRRERERLASSASPAAPGAAGIRGTAGTAPSAQVPKPVDPKKRKPKDPKQPPDKKPKVPKPPKLPPTPVAEDGTPRR